MFPLILEYLSSEKMGVARFLVYKKQVFETTVFSAEMIKIYTYFFMLGAIICLILLLAKAKGSGLGKYITLLVATVVNVVGIFFLHIGVQLHAYHFFLIGIMIVIVIQYLRIIYIYYPRNRK